MNKLIRDWKEVFVSIIECRKWNWIIYLQRSQLWWFMAWWYGQTIRKLKRCTLHKNSLVILGKFFQIGFCLFNTQLGGSVTLNLILSFDNIQPKRVFLSVVTKIDFSFSIFFRENNFNPMSTWQALERRRRHSMFTFYTLQLLQWLLGCQRPPALTYPQPVININAWPSS